MANKKRVTPKGVPRDISKKMSTGGKKRKNNFDLRKEYQQSWNYIKDSRNFIYSIVGIFFLFALIGFFVPASPELEKVIMDFLKELLEKTKDFNQWEMTEFLFLNNLQSSFFGLLLGIILGIFPVLASIVNGYVLGFVALKVVESESILVLWRLFPHGIFELPAVFISLGLGLKLGFPFISRYIIYFYKKRNYLALFSLLLFLLPSILLTLIFSKKLRKIQFSDFINRFWNGFRVFILIVIPLLVVAAIIESCLIFLIG